MCFICCWFSTFCIRIFRMAQRTRATQDTLLYHKNSQMRKDRINSYYSISYVCVIHKMFWLKCIQVSRITIVFIATS